MSEFGYIAIAFFVTLGVCFLILELCKFFSIGEKSIFVFFSTDNNFRDADIIIKNDSESEKILSALAIKYDKIYVKYGESEWTKKK
ncbi:MAG: hypothetical protein RR057_05845 [Clostridia bacterium]